MSSSHLEKRSGQLNGSSIIKQKHIIRVVRYPPEGERSTAFLAEIYSWLYKRCIFTADLIECEHQETGKGQGTTMATTDCSKVLQEE